MGIIYMVLKIPTTSLPMMWYTRQQLDAREGGGFRGHVLHKSGLTAERKTMHSFFFCSSDRLTCHAKRLADTVLTAWTQCGHISANLSRRKEGEKNTEEIKKT